MSCISFPLSEHWKAMLSIEAKTDLTFDWFLNMKQKMQAWSSSLRWHPKVRIIPLLASAIKSLSQKLVIQPQKKNWEWIYNGRFFVSPSRQSSLFWSSDAWNNYRKLEDTFRSIASNEALQLFGAGSCATRKNSVCSNVAFLATQAAKEALQLVKIGLTQAFLASIS